jgi:hypothetical protein
MSPTVEKVKNDYGAQMRNAHKRVRPRRIYLAVPRLTIRINPYGSSTAGIVAANKA